MAEPQKVDLDKQDRMFQMMAEMQKSIEALKAENQALREETAELREVTTKIPDMASTLAVIEARNDYAEKNPPATVIQPFSGYKKDPKGPITHYGPNGPYQVSEIPFTGKKDCCPFCTSRKDKSLLDLTQSGRWACRQCGKHWYEDDLGKPWDKKFERSQFIRNENQDTLKAY